MSAGTARSATSRGRPGRGADDHRARRPRTTAVPGVPARRARCRVAHCRRRRAPPVALHESVDRRSALNSRCRYQLPVVAAAPETVLPTVRSPRQTVRCRVRQQISGPLPGTVHRTSNPRLHQRGTERCEGDGRACAASWTESQSRQRAPSVCWHKVRGDHSFSVQPVFDMSLSNIASIRRRASHLRPSFSQRQSDHPKGTSPRDTASGPRPASCLNRFKMTCTDRPQCAIVRLGKRLPRRVAGVITTANTPAVKALDILVVHAT
jgi:hypothetical protein